ncbi:MAG: hypothetical protein JO104_12340 [Candidatus Eremiobacteraeota bacterium]|nr:hypothetical protein [Candidatus Eremiobacteraeota bacterium]
MIYQTLSIDGTLDDARRAAVDEAVQRQRGRVTWRFCEAARRSYALLEWPDGFDAEAIRTALVVPAHDAVVIAVAVFPTVAEALPHLVEALGGSGRPAGMLACREISGGVIVEWDPKRTSAGLIFGLIDLELRRFNSGRRNELLSPLPASVIAEIAAQGLEAPQLDADRILELRIGRA